ncbi:helicase associated domain-containing protein [Streptomyces flavidovirens]|uniref:Helicase associated domain-containing protein n=1 Tax=Streptomyces flavidovirens TaxID=67298 RepID=A0ABW6RPV7_9ACTN
MWSHFDVAFEEGLSACRGWAQEHGHLLPPVTATWNGYPVGTFTKNLRAAARRAQEDIARRDQGLPPAESSFGARSPRNDVRHWRRSTRPGARGGPSPGNAPSTSPASTLRPATRCPASLDRSASRAKISASGSAHSRSSGTS